MDEEFRPYVDAWRERWRARAQKPRIPSERERRARDALPRLVALLRDDYGASRIILVGSLARQDFREWSDIDLVIEGLSWDDWFRAQQGAEEEARLPVDLIRWEDISPGYRDIHLRWGEVLHGKDAAG